MKEPIAIPVPVMDAMSREARDYYQRRATKVSILKGYSGVRLDFSYGKYIQAHFAPESILECHALFRIPLRRETTKDLTGCDSLCLNM